MAKILFVDDMASMRKRAIFALQRVGHEAMEASDGVAADYIF